LLTTCLGSNSYQLFLKERRKVTQTYLGKKFRHLHFVDDHADYSSVFSVAPPPAADEDLLRQCCFTGMEDLGSKQSVKTVLIPDDAVFPPKITVYGPIVSTGKFSF
jgi:hypothetical protein